eukprot:g6139.t1 g6139   contig20:899036-901327(-)
MCAYELLVKRHAMDSRFQTIDSNIRVAAMFVGPILDYSLDAYPVLARMNANQQVRGIWLICLLYVLQEGPEVLVRDKLQSFCRQKDNRINIFVSVLKLACATFQYLMSSNDVSFHVLDGLSKEMTQECYNTLSATVILLIEECFDTVASNEYELEKLAKLVFDLLLHVLATPQSSVTLLRTLGGSAHAFDKFGASIFLRAVGNSLQHWGRIIVKLMNSTELSVRSMSVDFFVSLLGGVFNVCGNVDIVNLIFLSILPEVVAREIALCSASGLIKTMEDAASSLWPLRRAFADVEETNPLDDDRIDPQMLPSISAFCRTGQAIIDGVLIEMRLREDSDTIDLEKIAKAQRCGVSSLLDDSEHIQPSLNTIFDADEESLLEASNFFPPETSLPQRMRWLFTLKDLHCSKNQWSEAAETLILGAHSLLESLGHLPNRWRPSRFDLWSDYRRFPWLSSIGLSHGTHSCGNVAVIEYANAFLERASPLMTVTDACSTLNKVVDDAFAAFANEDGLEDIAYSHFEELLNKVSTIVSGEKRRNDSHDMDALRRVRANICTRLAQLTEKDTVSQLDGFGLGGYTHNEAQCYVRVVLRGEKPLRFKESTTIPTFFEWDMASICRVRKSTLTKAKHMMKSNPKKSTEECICFAFAEPLVNALKGNDNAVVVTMGGSKDVATDDSKTYIDVVVVQMKSRHVGKSRRFFVRSSADSGVTEFTVAHTFPHALARQRALITSEITPKYF